MWNWSQVEPRKTEVENIIAYFKTQELVAMVNVFH